MLSRMRRKSASGFGIALGFERWVGCRDEMRGYLGEGWKILLGELWWKVAVRREADE